MKAFYALIFGLVLLPACGKKKTRYEVDANDNVYAVERVSGVETALDLK